MKYTIYKNEVGQLMAMEGHAEFDGVVAKVYDLETDCSAVHFQPETPLEHHWFNLGHNSSKLAEENKRLKAQLDRAFKVIKYYADFDQWGYLNMGSDSYSVIDKDDLGTGEFYANDSVDDSNVGGKKAREFLRDES